VPDFTITELLVPDSLSGEGAQDFIGYADVANRVIELELGFPDFTFEANEILPQWRIPNHYSHGLVAKVDGVVVGWGQYAGQESASETQIYVEVAGEHRGQGMGSAMFDQLVALAKRDGRTVLQTEVFTSASAEGAQLSPASGIGALPADSPGATFALARGFVLEQVARISRVALPVVADVLAERQSAAREGYGDDYEIVLWQGDTPEQYLDDVAVLHTRMSTDTPTAGLTATPDVWDADRVREMETEFADSPRIRLSAAAREVASGNIVGFTQLDLPAEPHRPVNQWATLVLREHRGRRLGLALKLANLVQLQEVFPGHPSVTTINAAENEHMLDVNVSVGFVPVGWAGNFQRPLES
jgi:GNAT superfamily N-acetyltransferase